MALGLVVALALTNEQARSQTENSIGDLSQASPEQIADRLERADQAQRRLILEHLQAEKGTTATVALLHAISRVPAEERRLVRDLLSLRLQRMTTKTLTLYLAYEKNDELRLAAARAAGMKRDAELVDPLIQRLSDPNPLVAIAAHDSLKVVTGQDFGELDVDRADSRSATIERWIKWRREPEASTANPAGNLASEIPNNRAAGRLTSENKAISAKLEAYWKSRGIDTQESCSVSPIDGNEFIAAATLGASDRIALAIDEYGKGRIAYYCDMTTIQTLVRTFPDLIEYLGRRPNPRTLVFGYEHLAKPLGSHPGFDWAGTNLPPKYARDATALAEDYDLVIFAVYRHQGDEAYWKDVLNPTLREFTKAKGRGLMLVADYNGALGPLDFQILNSVANDAKARFNAVRIGWQRANFNQ